MGTFSAELLGSDSALDFIEEIEELAESKRIEEIVRVLGLAANDPSSLFKDIVPEDVISAAVLVAASLPAGVQDLQVESESIAGSLLPSPVSMEVQQLAIRAIDVVASPDGWWSKSWTSESNAALASEQIGRLRSLLREGLE